MTTLIAADIRKACNSEQHFSVDARPVSAERGLMKELSKTYKQFLRNVFDAQEPTPTLTKPFLHVRILCPSDSYDVNVEPAKDEVLFYDPIVLRDLFKQLMENVYGTLDKKSLSRSERASAHVKAPANSSFDMLLARKPEAAPPDHNEQSRGSGIYDLNGRHADSEATAVGTMHHGSSADEALERAGMTENTEKTDAPKMAEGLDHSRGTDFNMFSIEDEDEHLINEPDTTPSQELAIDDDDELTNANVRNPWSLAKLNIRLPPKRAEGAFESLSSATDAASPLRNSSRSPHRIPLGQERRSPTLSNEGMVPFQNPGPPKRPWAPRAIESDEDSVERPVSVPYEKPGTQNRVGRWVNGQLRASGGFESGGSQSPDDIQTSALPSRRSSAIPLPQALERPPQQQRLSLPFKTPFKHNHHGQNPSPASDNSHSSGQRNQPLLNDDFDDLDNRQIHISQDKTLQTPPSSSVGELDEIMEFERRKKAIAAQQRKQLAAKGNWSCPSMLPSPSSQSPVSNSNGAAMYVAAFPPGLTRPSVPSVSDEPQEDFGLRFADGESAQQVQAKQPLPARSNPHQNRYLAASRNLSQPQKDLPSQSHAHPEPTSPPTRRRRSSDDQDTSSTVTPKLPQSDPRAYLIRFRQQQAQQSQSDKNGLTRTGLKIRRAKTLRLPLEIVPADAAVHDLAVEVRTTQDVRDGKLTFAALAEVDEYVKFGKVDGVEWSPLSKEVGVWEESIKDLVQTRYGSSVLQASDDNGSANEDAEHLNQGCEFDMNLSRALKAFVDGDPV